MSSDLTNSDRTHLRRLLALAHEIEREWPAASGTSAPGASPARTQTVRIANDPRYKMLRHLMNECANTEGNDLRRLASWASHLHDEITLQHFYALIVPFERLSQRALRDDDFLDASNVGLRVAEGDRKEIPVTRLPLKIVLDNMRSAFNVGAIFRTAECLAASEILICGYTPDPNDEKTAKTAMGTGQAVPWQRFARVSDAVAALRNEGYTIVALETVPSAPTLHEIQFAEKTAIIVGNERFGLEVDVLALVDTICRIPMHGRKNSLNVGIAFGVAAYEWLRQQSPAGTGNELRHE